MNDDSVAGHYKRKCKNRLHLNGRRSFLILRAASDPGEAVDPLDAL